MVQYIKKSYKIWGTFFSNISLSISILKPDLSIILTLLFTCLIGFLIKDWNYQKIVETYDFTEDNVKKVVRDFIGGKYGAMSDIRRSRTLELLKKDWNFEDIYRNDFKMSGNDASMKKYFVKLFKGFYGANRVWNLEDIKNFANTGFLGTT